MDESRVSREEVRERPSNVSTVVNPIASPEIPIPEIEKSVADVANPVAQPEFPATK